MEDISKTAGANMDAAGEAEKIGISRNRAVTCENDSEGAALNYEVVGSAVRRSLSRQGKKRTSPCLRMTGLRK